jgi:hypothetical protein
MYQLLLRNIYDIQSLKNSYLVTADTIMATITSTTDKVSFDSTFIKIWIILRDF